jgi:hypothetical protein
MASTNDTLWGVSASVGTDGYPIFALLDKTCITEEERAHLTSNGYDLEGEGRWLAYNLASQPPDRVSATSLSGPPDYSLLSKCAYGMETSFLLQLYTTTLPDILEGKVIQPSAAEDITGPQQLVYLYDSGNVNMTNINAAFANIAETLTTWTRTNGHQNYSETAIGREFHVATCLHVNWAWLALPAVIALLVYLVLCLTIIMTKRNGLPLWKSSPLTLLFHGPGGMDWLDEAMVAPSWYKGATTDLRTQEGMDNMAARIWVNFEDGDAGARLRQVGMRRKSEPYLDQGRYS